MKKKLKKLAITYEKELKSLRKLVNRRYIEENKLREAKEIKGKKE